MEIKIGEIKDTFGIPGQMFLTNRIGIVINSIKRNIPSPHRLCSVGTLRHQFLPFLSVCVRVCVRPHTHCFCPNPTFALRRNRDGYSSAYIFGSFIFHLCSSYLEDFSHLGSGTFT